MFGGRLLWRVGGGGAVLSARRLWFRGHLDGLAADSHGRPDGPMVVARSDLQRQAVEPRGRGGRNAQTEGTSMRWGGERSRGDCPSAPLQTHRHAGGAIEDDRYDDRAVVASPADLYPD